MKRMMVASLVGCTLLLLLSQGHNSASAQDQSSHGSYGSNAKWETFENIQILKIWQLEGKGEKDYPQIALAQVSDQDFQRFIQNPDLLKTFVNAHQVFPVKIRTAGPWASLMGTNDSLLSTNEPKDPAYWLLTFSHSRTSNMAVASQPLSQ